MARAFCRFGQASGGESGAAGDSGDEESVMRRFRISNCEFRIGGSRLAGGSPSEFEIRNSKFEILPVSTYRLQFNRDFRFADACRILDYLHELGITDLYASPILKARPGSTHGYDVTDPTQVNPEIGTPEEFAELCRALQARDMGLIV